MISSLFKFVGIFRTLTFSLMNYLAVWRWEPHGSCTSKKYDALNTPIKLIKLRRRNQIDTSVFSPLYTDHILFIIALWLQYINLPFNRYFFLALQRFRRNFVWWSYRCNLIQFEIITFPRNAISERSMRAIADFLFYYLFFIHIIISIFKMTFLKQTSSRLSNRATTSTTPSGFIYEFIFLL